MKPDPSAMTLSPSLAHPLRSGRLSLLLRVNLLSVLVVPDPRWWSAIAATLSGSDTDDLAVNGAGDAVLKLQVHLGNGVLGKHRSIGDITDSGRLNHVPDGEPLNGLVLGRASRAVGATDGLNVAAALLVAAVGRSLLDHDG